MLKKKVSHFFIGRNITDRFNRPVFLFCDSGLRFQLMVHNKNRVTEVKLCYIEVRNIQPGQYWPFTLVRPGDR